MPKRSEHTEAVLEVVSEIIKAKHFAARNKGIPFMEEILSSRDEAKRFATMPPLEREQYIAKVGIDKAIEIAQRAERLSQRPFQDRS